MTPFAAHRFFLTTQFGCLVDSKDGRQSLFADLAIFNLDLSASYLEINAEREIGKPNTILSVCYRSVVFSSIRSLPLPGFVVRAFFNFT